jgi:hypothetical protein
LLKLGLWSQGYLFPTFGISIKAIFTMLLNLIAFGSHQLFESYLASQSSCWEKCDGSGVTVLFEADK